MSAAASVFHEIVSYGSLWRNTAELRLAKECDQLIAKRINLMRNLFQALKNELASLSWIQNVLKRGGRFTPFFYPCQYKSSVDALNLFMIDIRMARGTSTVNGAEYDGNYQRHNPHP
jgi:hypothetical protein